MIAGRRLRRYASPRLSRYDAHDRADAAPSAERDTIMKSHQDTPETPETADGPGQGTSTEMERRTFLRTAAVAGLGLSMSDSVGRLWAAPSDRIRIAIMGCNGRGSELTRVLASQPNTEVAYICDVDSRAVQKGIASAQKGNPDAKPNGIGDFRKALDDKNIDALVVAAPDHWHAPAAMLALAAGKNVYV